MSGRRLALFALCCAVLVAACGKTSGTYVGAAGGGTGTSNGGGSGGAGGSGGGSGGSGGSSGTAPSVAAIVDSGPAAAEGGDLNLLFVSVTLCAPGSTTVCQTIDHVQVDTGSTGFRVLAAALGSGLTSDQLKQATDANGDPVVECGQFADGYTWGPVKLADLTIGNATISSLPIQVIGDAQYATRTVPESCTSNVDQAENTVADFGANGLLGVGNFLQDCGGDCASGTQDGSVYNICPESTSPACQPAAIAVGSQVQNPAALLPSHNNGVVIQLPSVSAPGALTLSGTLTFGVGTASNNGLGNASVYTLDEYGNFSTNVAAVGTFGESFLDSGSNGYFFNDSDLPACPGEESDFYCPASPVSLSASIEGTNGAAATIPLTIDDAATAFDTEDSAIPGLAGSVGSGLGNDTFDWGLPFFFGRSVYVVFEDRSAAGSSAAGPYIAF